MHVLVTVEQKHRRCLKQYEHHGTTIPALEYLPLHLCSVKEKESPPPFFCYFISREQRHVCNSLQILGAY